MLAFTVSAQALSGGDWQAGRIIDDSVFFDTNTMSPQDIQLFLNSKVPVCDTNGNQPFNGTTRAAYATSAGYPPPYTCLKDYTENTPTEAAEPGLCGQYNGGNKSAAQIIYDVAQACGINPKVIVVLLQKEQGLITDDWPWSIEYQDATGYGCTGGQCNATYSGFFNQVYNAARQFLMYDHEPTLFGHQANQNNFIQYGSSANCGGSTVYIQNQATAGLYNYTPYQPDAAALNNLNGSGDSCSSYGNRNFWVFFNEWFGTVDGPAFAWQYVGANFYADAARTQPFSGQPTVQPGGKVYVTVTARNIGYLTWDPSFIRLGTDNPRDHIGLFQDNSWLYPTRPAQLTESSVQPSETGTFQFSITAPRTTGSYKEYYTLVADGYTWLSDLNTYYSFNVVTSTAAPSPTSTTLGPGQSIGLKHSLLAPLGQMDLSLQADGNLVLNQDYSAVWQTETSGELASALVMQTDGNLVLYDQNGHPLWYTATGGNPGAKLSLQYDGNMVLYSSNGTVLWAANTAHNPNYSSYVNTTLYPGILLKGQWLETADRRYQMILQNDGNLVIYSPQRAIWETHTDGSSASYLAMQTDGNLVLYDQNDNPIWQSGTAGRGVSALVMQTDGNLVVYQGMAMPTWNTQTGGVQ